MPTRRAFLTAGLVVAGTVVVPAAGVSAYTWSTAKHTNVGRVRFDRRLPIPPLAAIRERADGARWLDLALQPGSAELVPGRRTATWGVNGPHLGPTIRVQRGWCLNPRVHNKLPEPTTLHWHGMKLPARADGGPHSLIAPGKTWAPEWEVDQPAATLWYHPHPHGATKEHVYRGVAGLIYVDDPHEQAGLPRTYGLDDIPVILQDVNLTDDDQLDFGGIAYGGLDVIGLLGSEMLVNGITGAVLPVRTQRVRLRVLNASNARIYNLTWSDGRPFHLVGVDAGLIPAPLELHHLQLSPGERAEIVVALQPGERVRLLSVPPDLGADLVYGRLSGGDDRFELLELQAADDLRPSSPLPSRLPAPPPIPDPVAGHPERRFVLGDFLINGQVMDLARIDAVVRAGTSEIWRVHSDQGAPHNWHVHNAAFEVLSVDGGPPPPEQLGRKDTVYVPPNTEVVLRVAFGQHLSARWPYMFHCHLLAHEDAGMMGQFLIVDAATADRLDTGGVQPSVSAPSDGHHEHGR